MGLWSYSSTAASNSAIGGVSVADATQKPNEVNNAQRAQVADLANFVLDISGGNVTGGSANAQTVTTDSTLSALANGVLVTVRANYTNTAATTLQLDSTAAKSVRKFTAAGEAALSGGEIIEGGIYTFAYSTVANSAAGGWILLNPSLDYQENTFTPGISFGGGATGVTYGTRSGAYTKIGNRILYDLDLPLTNKGSSTGQLLITGLPITAGSVAAPACLFVSGLTSGVGDTMLIAVPLASSTTIALYKVSAGGLVALTEADVTNTFEIYLSGHYR